MLPSIRVKDVKAAVQFYTEKLGFTLNRTQEVSDNNSLTFGDASIMLEGDGAFYSESYNAAIRQRLGSASASTYYIEADDLNALYAKVSAGGVKIVDPLADRAWGQAEFTLEDPEGNWVTFWHAL
ncbi:MAG: VOC family protein [bacterium]